MIKNIRGFTIAEVTISLAIFLIIVIGANNLITYAVHITVRVRIHNELKAQARIAMEFFSVQIGEGQRVELESTQENTLIRLRIHTDINTLNHHIVVFRYDHNNDRNWVLFGGQEPGGDEGVQELSRYINNVEMVKDLQLQLLHITITTDTKIERFDDTLEEPIILYKTIDLTGKVELSQ